MSNNKGKTVEEMTADELKIEMARLQRENESLKIGGTKDRNLSFKISSKTGTVCVYGLGRFPVSLYKRQWQRLIAQLEEFKAFLNTVPDDAIEQGKTEVKAA